ncbi:hypothetical protein MMC15_007634 [Xylographa vitiligo]|nr:hypothetical protein [Xylographa vitiligo]
MLSLRKFARSVPQTVSRLSTPISQRPLSVLYQSTRLQQPWRIASRSAYPAFSTSRIEWAQEGQTDQELSAKLQSELQLERDMNDSDDLPPSLRDFLDNNPFEVQDTPGQEEVTLTRTFGDETIRITFSIADLNALNEDPDQYSEDKAMFDEDAGDLPEEGQSGGAQTKGTINMGRTKGGNYNIAPEDSIAPADRPELADDEFPASEDDEPSFPARLNITIQKPNSKGAFQVEATAQDGMIVVENVYYFSDGGLAEAKSPQEEWDSRNLYTGPPYGNLDQDLQVMIEKYLDERGINTALALWVPDYIDYKEQREYLNWLSEVKYFVDA